MQPSDPRVTRPFLMTVVVAGVLGIAIAVPSPATAATVAMATRSETAPKGPDYQVPVMSIAGDAGAERIEIAGTRVRGDVRAGAGCTQSAPDQVDCGLAVDISVHLGDGDDHFVAAAMTTPLSVDGGPGADVLASEGGTARLSGGDGDDALRALGTGAWLSGGRGADRLETAAPASASWADEAGPVEVDLREGAARTPSGLDTLVGEFATVYLGKGDDRMLASDGAVSVYGGAGDDIVLAGAGNDRISGEEGDDVVSAAAGDDELFGGSGADRLSGGDGDDTLYGGQYVASPGWSGDRLAGGAGDDLLTGRGVLRGGDGDDRLSLPGDGGLQLDRLTGLSCGSGADEVDAPGAYVLIPGDCERISGTHADESTVTFTRTAAGGWSLRVHGPRCRRRAVVSSGGRRRAFPTMQPSRTWKRVLIARAPLRPALVSLTRCDTGRVMAVVTLGR